MKILCQKLLLNEWNICPNYIIINRTIPWESRSAPPDVDRTHFAVGCDVLRHGEARRTQHEVCKAIAVNVLQLRVLSKSGEVADAIKVH